MDVQQKVLFVDAASGFYRVAKYPVGDFFGPVDLGLHLAGRFNSLNFGVGLLAGSILPGSNHLVVTGFSPCWGGFVRAEVLARVGPFDPSLEVGEDGDWFFRRRTSGS